MQNNAARMGEEGIARLLVQFSLPATVGMLVMSGLFGLDGVWASRPLSDLLAVLITFMLISRELRRLGIPLHKRV